MDKQPTPYVALMQKEFDDLSEKVRRIQEFVHCPEAFKPLGEARQHLLLEQLHHMEMYQSALNERIILETKRSA